MLWPANFSIVLVVCGMLVGCVAPWPDAPVKKDSLHGYVDSISTETAPENCIKHSKMKRLAWIPSTNTMEMPQYSSEIYATLEKRRKDYDSLPGMTEYTVVTQKTLSENSFTAESLMGDFQPRFSKVERVNRWSDLNKYDYLLVVDLHYTTKPPGPTSRGVSTSEVTMIFFDQQSRKIAQFTGKGHNATKSSRQLDYARKQAVEQVRNTIDDFFNNCL